ncbi:hypothetical protein BDZ89DRAFT_1061113 [Hymenopellis radicata]|nr:hypothetical protein BDZ89DRAFT_1061113 [Hymenopellis radicata]
MSFDPSSLVSLVQSCQTLYSYFNDVKQPSTARRRLLDEVLSLQLALEALQKLVNTPQIAGDPVSMEQLSRLLDWPQHFAEGLRQTLADVEAVLKYRTSDLKANRLKVLWRRVSAALGWTIDKAEVRDLLSDLERHKSRITRALQRDIFKEQGGIDGKLDDMDHPTNYEDRLRIAKFISDSDMTGHQRGLLEQRLSGTGTWILRHPKFVAWRDNRESPRTVWCHGSPGVGKSVLAASIVDHLQSMGSIVLSIFCRYSSNVLTTPFPVLRSLLRELVEKTANVPSSISKLYWTQTDLEPDALSTFLAETAALHAQPIYIVVDALDECPIGVELLTAIQNVDSSFRILVTSRPVFREIEEYPSIKIRASNDDILIAVDATLPKLDHAWVDEELKEAIRMAVVDKADGMFLLAALQLRELARDLTCRDDVIAFLESLPDSLDEAYELSFQRIRGQGKRRNELACRTLALIASKAYKVNFASRVQHLLAEGDRAQYTDVDTLLQCCHGLVECNGNNKLEFIHYSVYEYTTAHWAKLFPENLNRFDVCLKLGYSIMTRMVPDSDKYDNALVWHSIVDAMVEPEDLDTVMSMLSTPAARSSLGRLEWCAPLVHDPLLIAFYLPYRTLVRYMIQTATPDLDRFNEALRASRRRGKGLPWCIQCINERLDMRVNSEGVVVAVDARKEGRVVNEGEEPSY